jgi:hypothetical protein
MPCSSAHSTAFHYQLFDKAKTDFLGAVSEFPQCAKLRLARIASSAVDLGVQLLLARNLDRHDAVQLRVLGLPYTAKRADAQTLDQLEVGERPRLS